MLRKTKVLLIDDFPFARTALRLALAPFDCEIIEAGSGVVGLNLIEEAIEQGKPFHLVICDHTMPGMTGLELLKQCRADPKLAKVNFVIITAQGDEPVLLHALSLKALDFLRKPMPAAELEKRLRAILEKVATT